ncbi:MAG TPA: hypothetical protein VJ875_06040 [Pyrinomonadaceae bacterium]|nr:hypothetical protein [Pyrinomonadaceae bacterium]
MNLLFLPGQLRLDTSASGDHVITVAGEEVFRSRHEKRAITRYNEIRSEMEGQFPARELTREEKQKILEKLIGEFKYTAVRNSMKIPKKENIPKTRTFG